MNELIKVKINKLYNLFIFGIDFHHNLITDPNEPKIQHSECKLPTSITAIII